MTPSTLTAPTVPESVQKIFDAQAATALRLRQSTWQERAAKIRRLRDAVIAHSEDWYAAAHADFGKPAAEVDMSEILPVCIEANSALRHLKRWMRPQRVWPTLLTLGTRSAIEYIPRGRCLIMGPFNYPVNLTLGPLVSAIAAGNTAIVKPSEQTPALSALIAQVVAEVFGEDEVTVLQGDATLAQALQTLPFDHVFFTGSPAVGKQVMAACAQHLSSVTLELGGQSPTVVDASADIAVAAQSILWAKLLNAGQTCIAPDHVYVHTSVYDAWVQSCKKLLAHAYGTSVQAQQANPHLARMVSTRHTARLVHLLQEATAQGAQVLAGGHSDTSARFVQPTLLGQVPPTARIMDEEIFGPLLPVIRYTALDEVIAAINAGPKPLALYIYSQDTQVTQTLLRQTASGGVCVNHALMQYLHHGLPFGGINTSGIGQSHGFYGFQAFSHARGVVRSPWALSAKLLAPGATPGWMRKAVRLGLRWL